MTLMKESFGKKIDVYNTCSPVSHDTVDDTLVLIMMLPLIINLV